MGLGFIVSVWLARYLGPEKFGLFNYALAIIAIYTSVASLGMNGVVVRELIRAPEDFREELWGHHFYYRCWAVSLQPY
ncbi:oligosaccharide flippase family protein [Gibbsiella quercinecans]|uniref:oligosaccharide flippase family protein n=1 Tax=Gibbsiella quercinecans TaxID=929813 RepID=UPI003A4DDF7B